MSAEGRSARGRAAPGLPEDVLGGATTSAEGAGVRGGAGGRIRWAVQELWAGEGLGAGRRAFLASLAPFEAGFRLAAAARNAWHDRARPVPAPVSVVSVGNLVAGGTGKSPVVRWLRQWFAGTGARAAVVCRGYGGDEAAMHRRWFGGDAVFSGPSRAQGVRRAWERGWELVLLDDGFQHRSVHRDLDILLVAAEDPLRVRLLPRGPYREPLSAAKRATHVLVTRRSASRKTSDAWRAAVARATPRTPVLQAEMEMGEWTDLNGAPTTPPPGDVLAVSAIARPRDFQKGLRGLLPSACVEAAPFADHHPYSRRDVDALLARRAGRTVVCTEKDAVKLSAFPELARHCVAVGFRVVGEPPDALSSALADAAQRRCGSP